MGRVGLPKTVTRAPSVLHIFVGQRSALLNVLLYSWFVAYKPGDGCRQVAITQQARTHRMLCPLLLQNGLQ